MTHPDQDDPGRLSILDDSRKAPDLASPGQLETGSRAAGDRLDDLDDLDALAAAEPARSSRLRRALVALVLASGGFVGGIAATQQLEADAAAAGLPPGVELPEGVSLPEGLGGGGVPSADQLAALQGGLGGGQLPQGLGGSSGGTAGTVSVIDGSTLYLKDTAGTTVKVRLEGKGRVRHLAAGSLQDLRPGDQVQVSGKADSDGTIRATRVDQQP